MQGGQDLGGRVGAHLHFLDVPVVAELLDLDRVAAGGQTDEAEGAVLRGQLGAMRLDHLHPREREGLPGLLVGDAARQYADWRLRGGRCGPVCGPERRP